MTLRIMIFSWNSASIRINSTLGKEEYYSYIWGNDSKGVTADFIVHLLKKIQTHNPDVMCFGTQESAKPGDYLHSYLLPPEMEKLGYVCIKRTRLIGVGVSTYKILSEEKSLVGRGLRSSIYVKRQLQRSIEREEEPHRAIVGDNFQRSYIFSDSCLRNKGAIASYLKIPGYDLIVFINCHLPFDANSLHDGDKFTRLNAVMKSNTHFNMMMRDLAFNKDQSTIMNPINIFVFGDLNYRVTFPENIHSIIGQTEQMGHSVYSEEMGYTILERMGTDYTSVYVEYDELKQEMSKGNIYSLLEGKDNKGPEFMPTCKMIKGRRSGDTSPGSYNIGKHHQRNASWCDRILYLGVTCEMYDRFYYGNMNKSDHAAVYGVYLVQGTSR